MTKLTACSTLQTAVVATLKLQHFAFHVLFFRWEKKRAEGHHRSQTVIGVKNSAVKLCELAPQLRHKLLIVCNNVHHDVKRETSRRPCVLCY